MKRLSIQAPGAVAAMVLLAAVAMITSSGVLASDAAHKPSTTPVEADKDSAETVETHIRNLHDKFRITASQESEWNKVAGVMRDNADRITRLAKERHEHASSMTAVDDLKSYAEITEAHETGVAKLLPAFTTLYNDMSDAQKKAADAEFRERHHHHQM